MRSATSDGVAHLTRAVGDGLGDDVGIYTLKRQDQGPSGDGDVTFGKILHFFDIHFFNQSLPAPGLFDTLGYAFRENGFLFTITSRVGRAEDSGEG